MDLSDLPGVANGAESDGMEFDSEPQVGEKRDISVRISSFCRS